MAPQASVILKPGDQVQYTARVAGALDTSVTWSSTDGLVDANGLYTAPTGKDYTCQTITVVANADKSKSQTAKVSLSPTGNLFISGTYIGAYRSAVLYQNGTQITGTLASYDQGYAFQGTLNGYVLSGAIQRLSDRYTTSMTVTFPPEATSFSGGLAGVDNNFECSRQVGLVSIDMSPKTLVAMAVGDTKTFQARVAGAVDASVGWTATGGTIANGTYAPDTHGTQTVTATSTADPSKSATVKVLVTDGNPAASLAAHWAFEEGFGTTARDGSGHALDGTLLNGALWTPSRLGLGQAMRLSSFNSFLQIPDATDLNPTSITLSLWLNLASDPNCDGNSNWRSILHKSPDLYGPWAGYAIVMDENRTLTWDTGNGVTDRWFLLGITLPVGRWTHLVLTYDAETGLKQAFQDGVLKDSKVVGAGPLVANTSPLQLGFAAASATPNGYGNFDGSMDDVRIYSRTLSPSEVAGLFGPVAISPRQLTLAPGQTATFLATPSGTEVPILTWGTIGGTIDASGKYTAPMATGTFEVTVSSSLDPGHPDTAMVTVKDFDATDGFSLAQNPNGVWSYGWASSLLGGFQAFPYGIREGSGRERWSGDTPSLGVYHIGNSNALVPAQPSQLILHPGGGGQYSLLRWTAPAAGTFNLSAAFAGADSHPTSTDVHVLQNGSSIFDGYVGAFLTGPTFTKTLPLQAGDQVDVAVGFGNGSEYYDSTDVRFTLNRERPAVTLLPSGVTLAPGQTQTFAPAVTGLTNAAVTWSVQEGTLGGAITPAGAYTAPLAPGVYHVVATSQEDATVLGMATVAVTP